MLEALKRHIDAALHPAGYHGHGKTPPFFEGWYIKLVDAREERRFAIIPGIFLARGDRHAFVQVLDGLSGEASYHPYAEGAFSASPRGFEVNVGGNVFSERGVRLAIADGARPISGEVSFHGLSPWPVTPASPGAMGPLGWLPFLECSHGVLSFDHALTGALTVGSETIDFTGGRGYIEKDWGEAFPSAYVWQNSNHFEAQGGGSASLMASIAVIPSVVPLRGFIVGLARIGSLDTFATYTGARVEKLAVTDEHVEWVVRGSGKRIEMLATRAPGTVLRGPVRDEMRPHVEETMKATVAVKLSSTRSGEVLFRGVGRCAGLEVHGDIERLLGM